MAMKKKLPHPMKQGHAKNGPEYHGSMVQQSGRSYKLSKGESPSGKMVQSLFGGKKPA